MRTDTYNEHPKYIIEDVAPLVDELEAYMPIRYDELSVDFVTEATICELHERFLQNPEPTDVITFPAAAEDEEKVGEICISVDEALKYTHIQSLEKELTLYLVHGWLHLAGFDDIEEADRSIMRQKEQEVLQYLSQQPYPLVVVKTLEKYQ